MRRVILFVQVSLVGFLEGPKKENDWHMVDDEFHAHVNGELKAMGAFLSGRVTCELMAGFWPTADADPGSTPPVGEAPLPAFEGEGPAPPRRDPDFRERRRPPPVRTTPAPLGESGGCLPMFRAWLAGQHPDLGRDLTVPA